MNHVSIVGRLTKDPVYSVSNQTGAEVARFTVAVDRMPDKNGNRQADFISCVAFGKAAGFVDKYFGKGKGISLVGRIQTGSYEKNGQKIYTTDVIAERVEFVPGGNSDGAASHAPKAEQKPAPVDEDPYAGYMMTEEDIPF